MDIPENVLLGQQKNSFHIGENRKNQVARVSSLAIFCLL